MRTSLVLLILPALLFASAARAGDVDDTVYLKNGGRLRGVVIEEVPGKLIKLRLPDGTTRVLESVEVDHVQYGASAPTPTTPPPAVASPPVPIPPPRDVFERRSTPLMITGIVAAGFGAVAIPFGGIVAASNPLGDHSTSEATGAAFMVAGGVCLAGGLFGVFYGSAKVKVSPDAQIAFPSVAVGPRSLDLRWSF